MKQAKVLKLVSYIWMSILFLAVALHLNGCASLSQDELDARRSPEQRYQMACEEQKKGEDRRAAQILETIEPAFPYWPKAGQATMQGAQLYFRANRFDDTISLARRYIQFHPGRPDVEEAYALVAQSYFNKITPPGRDVENSQQALMALDDYLNRYPNGKWAVDLRGKRPFVLETLASKEMLIGRYYLSINAYIPALERFRTVVADYATTTQTSEALARMVEVYVTLGLTYEAQKTTSMLAFNDPHSAWYVHAYELLETYDMLSVVPPRDGIEPLPKQIDDFN